MRNKNILLIGGAGYIGLHVAILLYKKKYKIHIVDNLSNSKKKYLKIMKDKLKVNFHFSRFDSINHKRLNKYILEYNIKSIVHLAGHKSAEQSMINPYKYYSNNINCTISILKAMQNTNCNCIIFSSSACVYGAPKKNPINEEAELNFENIYGHTKLISEEIIKSYAKINKKFKYSILRYFNPIGSHESLLIGDDPKNESNNLMPNLVSASQTHKKKIKIYGKNYATIDGTCVRDYIHIEDLAEGHCNAIMKTSLNRKNLTINLGTGKGYTVLEVVKEFNAANSCNVKYTFEKERKGDVPIYFADPSKAKALINWNTTMSIYEMCKSSFDFVNKKID